MATLHSATARVRRFAKRDAIPWSNRANVLLCERPPRLDGIQVRRVRRQKLDARSTRFDHGNEARVLVSGRVVQDDDVSTPQLRRETTGVVNLGLLVTATPAPDYAIGEMPPHVLDDEGRTAYPGHDDGSEA